MLGRVDGWNSFVSMTLISNISKERRTKWLTYSAGECMNCMLQPLACIRQISKEEFMKMQQYMELVTKLQQDKMQQKVEDYEVGIDGILLYKNNVYVPDSPELRSAILKEMHNVPYVGHPGYQKAISALKSQYYWPGMKREIVDFIAKFLEFQRVKAKHRHPSSLLQPLPIPE
jgi:hypothetical protein